MLSERLAILIDVNGTKAAAEFKKAGAAAQTELGKAEVASKRAAATFTKMGTGMLLTGGIIAAGLYKATQAYTTQERAELKLQNTLANMPKLAGASADGLKEYAAELQKVTTFGDEATIESIALLGTFQVTEDQIRGMIPLVQDYAAKFDTDLNQATIQVGKALDGQVGALKRNGVSIDENLFKTDRYAAVTQALRNQVGGFAEQEAKTFDGQLQQMGNNLGDLAETLGGGAIQGFQNILDPISSATSALHDMNPELTEAAGKFGAIGSTGLIAAGALSLIIGQAIKMKQNFGAAADAVRAMVANNGGLRNTALNMGKIGGAAAGVAAATYAMNELADAMLEGDRGSKEVDRWSTSLAEFGRGNTMGLVNDELGEVVRNVTMTNSVWDNSIFSAGFGGFTVQRDIAEAREQLEAVDQALQALPEEEAAAAFANLSTALTSAGLSQDEVNEAFDGYTSRASDAAAASGDVGEGMGDVEDATDDATEKMKAQEDALRTLKGLLDDLYNSTLDAHEAGIELGRIDGEIADAAMRVNEVYTDGTSTAHDKQQAEQALYDLYERKAELLAKVTADQQGLNWAELDGSEKARLHSDALMTVAGTLSGPMRAELMNYAAQLAAIPESKTTQLKILVEQVFPAFNAAVNYAAGVVSNAVGFGGGRAAGGPVSAGKTYVVGENGPEVLTMGPGQSGHITPNAGGQRQPIVLQVDGREIARTMVDLERAR